MPKGEEQSERHFQIKSGEDANTDATLAGHQHRVMLNEPPAEHEFTLVVGNKSGVAERQVKNSTDWAFILAWWARSALCRGAV
jgi:hypothetical protein